MFGFVPARLQNLLSDKGNLKRKLCVWWNFEKVFQTELVPDSHAINTNLYVASIWWIENPLPGIGQSKTHTPTTPYHIMPMWTGVYLAPSDYISLAMVHFLKGRRLNNVDENRCKEFCASKPAKWYKWGIGLLAQRWHYGIYFDE